MPSDSPRSATDAACMSHSELIAGRIVMIVDVSAGAEGFALCQWAGMEWDCFVDVTDF